MQIKLKRGIYMRFILCLSLAFLCSMNLAVAQTGFPTAEFRVDFPETDPGEHRLVTWTFGPRNGITDPDEVEASVVSSLATVVNSGSLTPLSISVLFTENGYIVRAKIVSVDNSSKKEQSPVRVLVVYHERATDSFRAQKEFHALLSVWADAKKNGRTYDELRVARGGEATGVQTLISFFCIHESCPGKYPLSTND